jgi:hypothetical protein
MASSSRETLVVEISKLEEKLLEVEAKIAQLLASSDQLNFKALLDYWSHQQERLQIYLNDWKKRREDIVRNLFEQLSTELKGQNRGHVIEYYQNELETYQFPSGPPSGRYSHRINFII